MVLRAEKQSLLQPGSGRWERGKGERRVEREGRVRMRIMLMCLEKKDFQKEMEKQNKKIYILKANGTEIGF